MCLGTQSGFDRRSSIKQIIIGEVPVSATLQQMLAELCLWCISGLFSPHQHFGLYSKHICHKMNRYQPPQLDSKCSICIRRSSVQDRGQQRFDVQDKRMCWDAQESRHVSSTTINNFSFCCAEAVSKQVASAIL